ncbi:MAG TPA: phosphoglycerate kinase [Patescibacteria group bacterium]|nr:phosphoglycerate kinase [Patescibacteria group bacterium]
MKFRSVRTAKNLKNKYVLLRTDFNVPLENGKVLEDYRIVRSLPTIKYLQSKGARIIILSHLGRPHGYNPEFSLQAVGRRLGRLLGETINFVSADEWYESEPILPQLESGSVTLLDNVRFIRGEEKNEDSARRFFKQWGEVFVLDGFGVVHRDSATVSGLARELPSYAGLLLEEEVATLTRVMEKPKKPLIVVLGGAKLETKLPMVKKLLPIADKILLGGAVFNTYLFARGFRVGNSLIDKGLKAEALEHLWSDKIIMPVDVVVGKKNGGKARVEQVVKLDLKDKNEGIYDIGPATVRIYAGYLKQANTIIWNGAMGYFETKPYHHGTHAVARIIAARSKGKAFGVVGGGETLEVIKALNLDDQIDLISTGGGAMLEFLSGKDLPGLEALKK